MGHGPFRTRPQVHHAPQPDPVQEHDSFDFNFTTCLSLFQEMGHASIEDNEPALQLGTADPADDVLIENQDEINDQIEILSGASSNKRKLESDISDVSISEHAFKLRLANVPGFYNAGQLRKLINEKIGEDIHITCRKSTKSRFAFVGFRVEEEREQAMKCLDNWSLKNIKIDISPLSIDDDLHHEKYKLTKMNQIKDPKASEDGCLAVEERIQDQVTSLWRRPYENQLVLKHRKARGLIDKFHKEMNKIRPETNINKILDGAVSSNIVEAFKPSPVVIGYRNKCEFAIGKNEQNDVAIGFTLGAYKNGIVQTASPQPCLNVNEATKAFVLHAEKFVKESGFETFDRVDQSGFWRILVVRTFTDGQLMALFQVNGVYNKITDDLMAALKGDLIQHCQGFSFLDPNTGIKHSVASLQMQTISSKAFAIDPSVPFEVLDGPSTLIEILSGRKFEVSAHSFFQVNTPGSEVLYSSIAELAIDKSKSDNQVLLDLCCGAGTIGICLASQFKKVIGVEMVPDAIENAKKNSELNDVRNTSWTCGKLEDVLLNATAAVPQTDQIIVVLDPPRSGVHNNVVRAIRSHPRIERLVYVSCHPMAALPNFIDFCRSASKKYNGKPFELKKVIPVDMFPHTEHYELVLLFERDLSS